MKKLNFLYGFISFLCLVFATSYADARILVIAPHPEDDVIIASGIISRATNTQSILTYTDNFDRADGDLGTNWTAFPGFPPLTISGNKVVSPDASEHASYWNNNISNDQYAEITAVTLDSGTNTCVYVRASTVEFTGYFLNVGSSTWNIWKVVNGTGTQLVSEQSRTTSDGTTVRLTIVDHTLYVSFNGIEEYQYTDTGTPIPGGYPGISLTGIIATADNWVCSDVPEPVRIVYMTNGDNNSAATRHTDNFNRPDGDLGTNWTAFPGFPPLTISGNEIVSTVSDSRHASFWSNNIFGNNQYAEITAVTLDSGTNTCVFVRASTDSFTGYFLNVGSSTWNIWKAVNDIGTQLVSDQSRATSNGTTVRLAIVDNTLHVLFNGKEEYQYTDTGTPIPSGYPGISLLGTTATVDNFACGDNAIGYTREGEAVAAQAYLGVSEDQLIFLGYPDGSLNTLYTAYTGTNDQFTAPNGQSTTYGNRGLGRLDYHSYRFGTPAAYNRSNIVLDLADVISTYKPGHIFVTSEFDAHPDNASTHELLRSAISSVHANDPSYAPDFNKTIIWWGAYTWPDPNITWPNSYDPTSYFSEIPNLNSQTGLNWSDRVSTDVPLSMQSTDTTTNPKYLAIHAAASQSANFGFYDNFIHKDEIFWTENLTPPTVTGFTVTTPSASWIISISSFTVIDSGGSGIASYMITTSPTQPAAGAAGWAGTAPTTYTVGADGTYTLYPWAKDAAGNVSTVFGSPPTVVADTTPPTVTGFTATTPSNSLNISITLFTASDSGSGIASYMITTTSTQPTAGAAGWAGTAPTTYTVGADGTYTLYPWAKDTAGNVSAVFGSPRTVVVDTSVPNAPSVTGTTPTNETTPTWTWTSNGGGGNGTYQFRLDNSDLTTGATITTGTSYTPASALGAGTHTLYVQERNAVGTWSTSGSFAIVINKANPTLSVTNSPVIYNGSPQTATVSGSVGGSVSNIKYDGFATVPTNVGTYAVTADFAPTDSTDYNSLSNASAGNFVISKATPTASVTNSPVTYDGSPHAAAVTCLGGGASSNISTGGSSSQITAGAYAVTADCAASTNYNSANGLSAGNFVIAKTNQSALTAIATPSTVAYGSTAALSSSGGSGTGAVSYSAGASTGCSVVGITLSVTDVSGSCSVTATKAADTNYNVAVSTAVSVTLTVMPGDLNSDNTVDVTDALKALRIAAGLDTPTTSDIAHGDVAPLVNGIRTPDGKIDISDVVAILRKAVNLPSW